MSDLYPQVIERYGETWLDVAAAAERCGVHPLTVRRWVKLKKVRIHSERVYNKCMKVYVAERSLPAKIVPIAEVTAIPEDQRKKAEASGISVSAIVDRKTGRVIDLLFDHSLTE